VRDLAQGCHRLLLNLQRDQKKRARHWQDFSLAVYKLRRGILGE